MPEVITYSLRDGQRRSDEYYRTIADFTDEVLAEAQAQLGPSLTAFRDYVASNGVETPRGRDEYAFELLTLGVLWRTYSARARNLLPRQRRLLDKLVQWRQRYDFWKPAVDSLRGLLAARYLFPHRRPPAYWMAPTLSHLQQILDWLGATGDFKEEIKRLEQWQGYLVRRAGPEANRQLAEVIDFAGWFQGRALEVLGRFTPHVEQFLAETLPDYRWREDGIFCGRQRVEYHMNMVGTEVLNRAFAESFRKTERKVMLLPPCMRAKPDGECKAQMTPYGERCAACTPSCRVHQATKLGEKHGFAVFILPHELSVFSGGKVKPANDGQVGVVGVSCPLTNVTGGWETRDLGVPAQGVLLDYCGCSWHWHLAGGIPTDINFKQVLKLMRSETERPAAAEARQFA
jgi:hypothetical protein